MKFWVLPPKLLKLMMIKNWHKKKQLIIVQKTH